MNIDYRSAVARIDAVRAADPGRVGEYADVCYVQDAAYEALRAYCAAVNRGEVIVPVAMRGPLHALSRRDGEGEEDFGARRHTAQERANSWIREALAFAVLETDAHGSSLGLHSGAVADYVVEFVSPEFRGQ